MNIKFTSKHKPADTHFIFFFKQKEEFQLLSSSPDLFSLFSHINKTEDSLDGFRFYPDGKGKTAERIIFLELKPVKGNWNETFRRAGNALAKAGRSLSHLSASADFSNLTQLDAKPEASWFASFAEGFVLGSYQYTTYKKDENKKKKLRELIILCNELSGKTVNAAIEESVAISFSQIFARELVNAPGNELTPAELASRASKSAKEFEYKCTVLNKKQIKDLKMGGLLAVNKGSVNEPVFIILEHKPKGVKGKPVVLVGKGITFDTGGISIKPSAGMGDMKGDMGGAAAVIGTMEAIARINLPVHVIGLVPSTDNMPSGSAQCPGDIITSMAGITIEVDNTDAEGRLILCDALEYAKRYKPEVIIDLATLTGACVVALGDKAAGLMTTDDELSQTLILAGTKTYERVWPLPLFDEYAPQIKSDVADVKNVGGRYAGAITAGKFLQKFVDADQSWAHIDIAGPAFLDSQDQYLSKGGSGFGVRLLTDYLRTKVK
ncbi:MAG: leucyl aminopeptidase [Bacteroidetes bacterium]|nr:leucyl aminopeptidase [Bacteroidota bacterium]